MKTAQLAQFAIAYLIVALPLSFAIAGVARHHRRSIVGWFVFSLAFSPLMAILFLIALGRLDHADRQPCPRCAELVRVEALHCRHCGADLAMDSTWIRAGR